MTANITPASLALFLAYAEDARNWSGEPLVGGNVCQTVEHNGNLTQLKRAKLVKTVVDRGDAFVRFLPAGVALAAEHGIAIHN